MSEPSIGHNSDAQVTAAASDQLKKLIERIERLHDQKDAIASDIRDLYTEAKKADFDVKAMRSIVRIRKQDVDKREEEQTILETYMLALGMI